LERDTFFITIKETMIEALRKSPRWPWLAAAWVGALLLILYFPVLQGMFSDWISEPGTRHGLLVPVAVGFAVWKRRAQLESMPVEPSRLGWILLILAFPVYIAGQSAGDFLIPRLSLLISIAGLILALLGWKFWKPLALPLVLLVWAIRPPLVISTPIVTGMRQFAAALLEVTLRVMDYGVLHDGDTIEIIGSQYSILGLFLGMRLFASALFLFIAYAGLASEKIGTRIAIVILGWTLFMGLHVLRALAMIVLERAPDAMTMGREWGVLITALLLTIALHQLTVWWQRRRRSSVPAGALIPKEAGAE
jgi:exosortase